MAIKWLRHPRTKTAHAFASGAELSLCLNAKQAASISMVLAVRQCRLCLKSIARRNPPPAVMRERVKRRKQRRRK